MADELLDTLQTSPLKLPHWYSLAKPHAELSS